MTSWHIYFYYFTKVFTRLICHTKAPFSLPADRACSLTALRFSEKKLKNKPNLFGIKKDIWRACSLLGWNTKYKIFLVWIKFYIAHFCKVKLQLQKVIFILKISFMIYLSWISTSPGTGTPFPRKSVWSFYLNKTLHNF